MLAAKMRKASARRVPNELNDIAKRFGQRVHADHVFPADVNDDDSNDASTALVLKDDSTEFRGFYPQKTKSAEESVASIRHFIGPVDKISTLRTDNSREPIKAAKLIKVHHERTTPYHSENNARIEREIGVEVSGIRASLEQSGLPLSFWPQAGMHFAHYSNCLLKCREGQSLQNLPPAAITPWRKRFKDDWIGPTAPFGCEVRFRPLNASESLPKFASRTMPGLFLGVSPARLQILW